VAKGYWITLYRSVSDSAALAAYGKLARPAIVAHSGRFVARGEAMKANERGVSQRATVTESTASSRLSPRTTARLSRRLRVLGNSCEREWVLWEEWSEVAWNGKTIGRVFGVQA
jgi:hypothetical protein